MRFQPAVEVAILLLQESGSGITSRQSCLLVSKHEVNVYLYAHETMIALATMSAYTSGYLQLGTEHWEFSGLQAAPSRELRDEA
jgi:hypothetical protein